MAKNNAIDNKSSELTIDPGASGNSFVQFDLNTIGEFRIGVDDNAAFTSIDAFKISQGSAFGTNDTFIMTAAGERTIPLQPAFLAFLASDADNVTGNGTIYTLGTDALTEVFDQGGDFVTSGTFIAPITGRYLLEVSTKTHEITAADDTLTQIITANRTYRSCTYNPTALADVSAEIGFSFTVLADMDSGDFAIFTIMVDGEVSNLVDVSGSSTLTTKVAGFLAC